MDNPKANIHLDNIRHNIALIKNKANQAKILAVIKADAYGHGAVEVARSLDADQNVSALGVARYHEASQIQQAGITKPILLMEGVNDCLHLQEVEKFGWWIVIQSFHQLEVIESIPVRNPLKVWLKFNTGMNRIGFRINQTTEVLEKMNSLIASNKIDKHYVLMTHFAKSEEISSDFTEQQLNIFHEICTHKLIDRDNVELSAANSAGIWGWPDSHFDWVRPGISMYGSSPIASLDKNILGLKPSMSLIAQVISFIKVEKNEFVGYGCRWQAKRDSMIAIINCGYADCYPRAISDTSYVYLNNKKCRIVGAVSMDMLAIDCTDLYPNIKIDDKVELWGDNISIDEVANSYNTIANELYCRTTQRVERVYE